jgi:hypothetical protein
MLPGLGGSLPDEPETLRSKFNTRTAELYGEGAASEIQKTALAFTLCKWGVREVCQFAPGCSPTKA